MKIEEYIEQLIYEMVDDNFKKTQILEAFKTFDFETCIDIAIDDKLQG